MRLTSNSFIVKSPTSPSDSDTSQESVAQPPSVFIEMSCPRYLGPAPEAGAVYFFSHGDQFMDILQLEAPLVLGEKGGAQLDLSLSGSDCSIESFLARPLSNWFWIIVFFFPKFLLQWFPFWSCPSSKLLMFPYCSFWANTRDLKKVFIGTRGKVGITWQCHSFRLFFHSFVLASFLDVSYANSAFHSHSRPRHLHLHIQLM